MLILFWSWPGCHDQSGALLIEGAKADTTGSSSSHGGILTGTRGTTSACDFWGGVGVGREEASPDRCWGGIGDGFANDGDSDDDDAGGLGYGPGEDYGEDHEGVEEKGRQVRRGHVWRGGGGRGCPNGWDRKRRVRESAWAGVRKHA